MKVLQPGYFEAFHCIGAACEDTCCTGWIVNIDKITYAKYGPSLRALITISENSSNDEDYARVSLNGDSCPFLDERLCSIQKQFGEDYLSNMCATYPRILNRAGDVLRRSLDLSCPEAARVALLNPAPIELVQRDDLDGCIRQGDFPALDTSLLGEFSRIQRQVLTLLQDRSRPLWKRLFLAGRVCEEPQSDLDGIEHSVPPPSDPSTQLDAVVDLIVARLGSDSNSRRFLECYGEFITGLQWTAKSTTQELAAHYSDAHNQYYAPFMSRYEYILEHYLVTYAHRTLFPFGLPESNQRLRNSGVAPATTQYMWMVANYAITRTLLIGISAFQKSAFDVSHVIKLIQSTTKTFEHSAVFPARAIEILTEKNMTTAAALSVLIRH
jgi:lysine-N-methylase